ncbi:hypothetical protein LLS1_16350 [Leifsonia sp. LS1]|uniref:hypothetical protein n=1 Tax=Leifsonia sp. LS1 TaxID=2828483 RepID=UPI001CFD803D|nr:hypothetical protein [Leifsonia sp. LS1]GIT79966.1 hypothetical protein LLS1_16350 [Leifsonia sp. LS1]
MPRYRAVGLAVAASAAALALSGCSVVAAFTPHVDAQIFDSAKEFKAADTAVFGSPKFVPDDATIIRVDYDTQTGAAIMTYTSPTLLAKDVCNEQTTAPKAAIQDSWWPIDGVPKTATKCPGGWSAFAIGQQVYAALPAKSK